MLEVKRFGKYSILNVNSKNNEPIPENNVIRTEVIKIISKLLDFVAIPFVAMSLIVRKIAAIAEIKELNIGHSIISHAVVAGLSSAVSEMKQLIDNQRN